MDPILIIVIVIVSIFVIFRVWYSFPSSKGLYGEWLVKGQLKSLIKQIGGAQFHDIMLGENTKSTQIDNILVTNRAVYVLEVKNYSGRIYGQQHQDQWYQTIRYTNKRKGKYGKTYIKTHIEKNKFFNPIKQNDIHVRALKSSVNSINFLPIYNIVVFTNNADINNITMEDGKAIVIKRSQLKSTISRLQQQSPERITEINSIIEEINEKNTNTKSNSRQHVKRIKDKYRS